MLCFEAKLGRWKRDDIREFVTTWGPDPNGLYKTKQGTERTPLAHAVEFNHCNFARELLNLDPTAADPNLQMPDGESVNSRLGEPLAPVK